MTRRIQTLALLTVAVMVTGVVGSTARAGGQEPASLLIYPIYDSNPGAVTIMNVTNTHEYRSINLHFIYIDGSNWREFNRFERLTPRDHFSVTAAFHNPDSAQGFLYVIALDYGEPADFNYLVGDEIVADSFGNFLYALDAIGFQAKTSLGPDWELNFDDREYCRAPDSLIASSFIAQTSAATSTLLLIALLPSSHYETFVGFKVYNNNEQEFSTSYRFRCWAAVSLKDISGVFSDTFLKTTNWDPSFNGFTERFGPTSGWFEIDGIDATDVVGNKPTIYDPPVIGAFVQSFGPGFSVGRLLHVSTQKNSTNGALKRF